MLIRNLIFFSVASLFLIACGDKEEDTGSDSSEVVDSGSSDTSTEE